MLKNIIQYLGASIPSYGASTCRTPSSIDSEKIDQGAITGIKIIYETIKTKKSDRNENSVLKNIKIEYDTSEMHLACLYSCQNLALTSATYPSPV